MREAKEKNKILLFDMSRERLMDSACEKAQDGNFVDALSLLHKCAKLFGSDDEILEAFADIYEQMELYSKAVDTWFYYLDEYGGDAYETDEEVYEGLAVDYMNMGYEMESLLYYKKMIDSVSLDPDKEARTRVAEFEITDFFRAKAEPKLQFVPSPEKADYSKEINEGVRLMRCNDIDGAIKQFKKVDENSSFYLNAGNFLSICYALQGDSKKGLSVCKKVLKKFPDDVQTLSTLAALYAELGQTEKSKQLAGELCSRKVEATDALYKIATVAFENGMDDEAVEKFRLIEKKLPYDKNILYFLAVGEYRINELNSSKRHFHTLLSLYPDASVARIQMKKLLAFEEGLSGNECAVKPEIGYAYRISEEERGQRISFIKQLSKEDIEYGEELDDETISEAFSWCFDEFDGQDIDLQQFAVHYAIKLEYDGFLKKQLLRHEVSDFVKIYALYELVLKNKPCTYGVVIGNIYFKFRLPKIKLGQKKRKLFLHACADVISKFLPFSRQTPASVARAAHEIYEYAVKQKDMEEIDEASLRCAIYLSSGINFEKENISKTIVDFGADIFKVSALLPPHAGEEEAAVSDGGKNDRQNKIEEGEEPQ